MSVSKKKVIGAAVMAVLLGVGWISALFGTIFFAAIVGSFDNDRATDVMCQLIVVAVVLALLPSAVWFLMKSTVPRWLMDFETTRELEKLRDDVQAVLAQRQPPSKVSQHGEGAFDGRPVVPV